MSHHSDLPDPRPPRQHPPFMELSFAALGWLARAANHAGGVEFTEAVQRARFNLKKAAGYAHTPAEVAVISGLASSLEGLIKADADARELLGASLVDFDAAFEAACIPPETGSADDVGPEEHDASQDPAAGPREA